jgi:MFS superfamily sulfate permease-like transporter
MDNGKAEYRMRHTWAGDLIAGIGAGLAYLPLIVVVAILSFGALGTQTAVAMSIAVFGANIVAGVVLLVLARCPLLVGTPSGSSALVMAGLFGRLMAQGNVPDIADAMAITLAVGAVAGVVQLILVRAGAAGLGPLAPYPVVSGLVNGTAVSAARMALQHMLTSSSGLTRGSIAASRWKGSPGQARG